MKCPVCKNEIQEYYTVCPVCNFFGLHRDFVNVEDAVEWERTVLTYYRALWLRKQRVQPYSVNLETKEAIEIFQRYFTNESHKYRISTNDGLPDDFISLSQPKAKCAYEATISSAQFAHKQSENSAVFSAPDDVVSIARNWDCTFDGIEINTKYLRFTFLSRVDRAQRYSYTYGFDSYEVEYDVADHDISLYVKSTTDNKRDYICSLTIPISSKRNELLTVLEFMKAGDGFFTNPFDDNIYCWDELKHDDLTYKTYFQPIVKPLIFYAEEYSFSEDEDSDICNRGLCKISISVVAIGNKQKPLEATLKKVLESNEEYSLVIISQSVSTGGKPYNGTSMVLRSSAPYYDVYKNSARKSVYLGTLMEYTQFKFEDELLMQQVFNYLTIILAHWDTYYS